MANYQNHVIDPTYFYDAIEEFAFDYDIYVVTNDNDIDDYGNRKPSYMKTTIRGSLQSDGTSVQQSKEGNTHVATRRFYCKSLYRIGIGDIIEYKGDYFRVNDVRDYDEYGVRSATLTMIKLAQYRDFAMYLKYLNGEVTV